MTALASSEALQHGYATGANVCLREFQTLARRAIRARGVLVLTTVLSLLDTALALVIVLGVVFRPLSSHEDEPMTSAK